MESTSKDALVEMLEESRPQFVYLRSSYLDLARLCEGCLVMMDALSRTTKQDIFAAVFLELCNEMVQKMSQMNATFESVQIPKDKMQ